MNNAILYSVIAVFCLPWLIKYLILDVITQKLDDAVKHLRSIDQEIERMQDKLSNIVEIERKLKNSESHLLEMSHSIASIEKQLQWFGKDTFAAKIMRKLDEIESK